MDGIAGFTLKLSDTIIYEYTYKKNIQGDIIGIYDSNNVLICKYIYDAWGNHKTLILSNNGEYVDISSTSDYTNINNNYIYIANLNPFRYRGYYFDTDTGLYYLNSRYYDPGLGRFINADSLDNIDTENLNGFNLYMYCADNPVNNVDPNGAAWWHWLIGAIVVVAAAVAVVVTAGGAAGAVVAVSSVLAGSSAMTMGATIAAGVFIGAATTYTAMGIYAGIEAAYTWSATGSASMALGTFNQIGETAMWSTITAGVVGGVVGYATFNEQHPKITHSWTTERNRYWQRVHGKNSAIIGSDGYPMQLHHPYGRSGAGFYYYIPLTRSEHLAFHKLYGFKGFALPYPYTNYWDLILRALGMRS